MPDILSEIIANKRIEVELQKQSITIEQLYEGVSDAPPTPVSYTHLDVYKRQR